MNFPFKVRAWHAVQKRFYSAEQMSTDQLTLMPDGSGFINVHSGDMKKSTFIRAMIPELFVGRTDKNSKEIYEGDIVRAWVDLGPAGERQQNCAVTFSILHGSNLEEWTFHEHLGEGWFPEVIGNIHENPELLEKK